MAGDWIKMRGNLWDDPRIGALVDATDTSEAAVVGGLYWLWATADQHSEDGTMPGLTLRQIDRKTGITGFAAALVSIGWIEDHADGITIVKFDEHNGASAKKRCQTAKRVANHTAANAQSKRNEQSPNAPSVSPALAREREEKSNSVPSGTDGEAVASPTEMTKAELWSTGKSLLAEQGMPKAQCGSFVGKLCKDYGDEIVIEAVRTTCVARPADAAEYLKALCLRAAGQRRPTASTTTHDRRAATLAGLTNTGDHHAERDERTIDVEAHVVG